MIDGMNEGVMPPPVELQKKEESAPDILQENTRFMWQQPEIKWAGMDQSQLKFLTAWVGEILEITPEQAKKIQVIFGDHVVVNFSDNSEPLANTACCIADVNQQRQIEGCRVLINRSEELANASAAGSDTNDKISEGIPCVFENPLENVIWLLAEELHHAKYWLTAQNLDTHEKWNERYRELVKSKGIVSPDPYMTDLQEVAASRNALKVLKKLYFSRATYYQDLYDQSLRETKHVTPDIGKIKDQGNVKTGYQPPASKEIPIAA